MDSLKNHPWRLSYSTSAHLAGGKPIDILHDFYIPALQRSVRYDRVAGYFRSTSLAAASQGFSAFVANKGKVRMVVGADLNPVDVRAILDGAEERLAAALTSELEPTEPWPNDVANGVELLAWMVAHGFLEIRVAFRLHAATSEPLNQDKTSIIKMWPPPLVPSSSPAASAFIEPISPPPGPASAAAACNSRCATPYCRACMNSLR